VRIIKIISKKNIAFLAIILLPFDQVFSSVFPNFAYSPFRVLTIVLALFFFQYNISKLKPFKGIILLFFVYSILALVSIIWSSNIEKSFLYAVQLFVMLMFTIVSVSELSKEENIISKLAFFGALAGGVVSVLAVTGYFNAEELTPQHRLSFQGIGINAVAISVGFAFLLGISYFFLQKGSPLKKQIVLLTLLAMLYFLIRTGTRSAVAGVFIAIGLAYPLSFKIKLKSLISLIIVFSVLLFAFNYMLENYVSARIAERILSIGVEDIKTNSRLDLWRIGINWYNSNILGTGAGNETVAYQFIDNKEAHNVFVSSLIQLGIPAFLMVLVAYIIIFLLIKKIKNANYKFSAFLIYFFLLVQSMKGSFLQTRLFWIPLTIVMTIVIIDRRFRINKSSLLSGINF